MKPVVTYLFLDGRPGHEKQSRALISALKNYLDLRVEEITVEKKGALEEAAAYAGSFLLSGTGQHRKAAPALAIGSGSRTHIPLLRCRRRRGARAITCMSPSRLLRRRFDLCLVPFHDQLPAADNIFETIGPPTLSKTGTKHEKNRSLILVGGEDRKSHVWNQVELERALRKLFAASEKKRQWTVSSSPRTPDETSIMLEMVTAEHDNVDFIPYSKTPAGWVEHQYARNSRVWVTADSISMVYEALSAGCEVGILPVQWRQQNNKFHLSEQFLINHRRAVSFYDWLHNDVRWPDQPPLDEADRCAREIMRRWWPENLP